MNGERNNTFNLWNWKSANAYIMIMFSQLLFFLNACYVSVLINCWNKISGYFLNYLDKLHNMKMPGLFENNLRKFYCWQKALRSRGGCFHEIARNCTTFCEMMALKAELHFAT